MAKKVHVDDQPLELTHPPAELLPQPGSYHLQAGDAEMSGLTNLNLADPRDKVRFFNALNPPNMGFDENGVMTITATHFVLFPDEGEDPETGEVRQFTRAVLIDPVGNTASTTSAFAPRRLRAAMLLWGPEQWAQGIRFVLTERRSRKTGRTYHDLRVEETT
jgi:hypothetical protein